ncbi:MAG: hypothetical protein AAF206_17635 [Bacteroidota bacterium]
MKSFALLGLLMISALFTYGETIPFDDDAWTINAEKAEKVQYKGKDALLLENGIAWLPQADFYNGVIEFDVALPNGRSFPGVIFRAQDEDNFEEFYMRPHQSGNPDANQYNPVYNGVAAWQLYHGEAYAVPYQYKRTEWMHFKIQIRDHQAEVYFANASSPDLAIRKLKGHDQSGGIGLRVFLSGTHFANFSYTKTPPTLKAEFKAFDAPKSGTITEWSVSPIAFAEKELEGVWDLPPSVKKISNWERLKAEERGITNLAKLTGMKEDKNTLWLRLEIESQAEMVVPFSFGYSDRVRVFCNESLLYEGDNRFRSRDYRYLGTIGLFDTVYLPLYKGVNTLYFAVSEGFGGWGMMGFLPELDKLTVKAPR